MAPITDLMQLAAAVAVVLIPLATLIDWRTPEPRPAVSEF